MTEKEFLERYDNEDEFTEKELEELALDFPNVYEIEGDTHRWTQDIETIVEIDGRFFSIEWDRGLTERQENEFFYQPKEVKKRTYTKTIEVTEWEELNA